MVHCNICNESAKPNTTIGDIFTYNLTPGELDLEINIIYLDGLKTPSHVCRLCLFKFVKAALIERMESKELRVITSFTLDGVK